MGHGAATFVTSLNTTIYNDDVNRTCRDCGVWRKKEHTWETEYGVKMPSMNIDIARNQLREYMAKSRIATNAVQESGRVSSCTVPANPP